MKKEDIKNVAAAWQQVQEATAKQRALASIKPQPKDKVSLAPAPFDIPKKADKMPIAKKDVNELNKSTLASYIKKAADDGAMKKHKDVNIYKAMGDDENAAKSAKKAKNRAAGIATAADKLAKEAMDPVNHKALKGKHADRDDKDIDNDGDADSSDKYLHKRRKAITKNVKGDKDEVEMNPKKTKGNANADNMTVESHSPVYARILENRAAHTKGATDPQSAEDGGSPKAKELKKKMDDGKVDSKLSNYDELGHDDVSKAGRAGPSKKPRRNDNAQGDKAIINPAKATK